MDNNVVNVHATPFLGRLIDVTKYPGVLSQNKPEPPMEATAAAIDKTSDTVKSSGAKKDVKLGKIIHATTNMQYMMRDGEVAARRGNSALFGAINYINKQTEYDTMMVAWSGEEDYDERLATASEVKTVPIVLKGDQYRRYAEDIIWPALHYIHNEATDGRQEAEWWADYVAFNEQYCETILEHYKPGDVVWVHDYYLFLLPQLLRQKVPDIYIGFFMHAPFPSSEYFRALAKRKELLEGILGSNLVATQSVAYSRHFISSATRLLGVESGPNHVSAFGVHVSVEAIPIGIDTVQVEKHAFNKSVDDKMEAIRSLYPNQKIIVGRDRLDSIRGVVQKLQAFETFLKDYPEWRERVVLIQVTSPAYNNYSNNNEVSELISRINGTYGTLNFAPVHHYPRHIARDEYFALLRVADLGLITSVRDGMNTTSLEFVVCQRENNSPVILSEFTGTAGSLDDSIQVNPWDAIEVAATINGCLTASDEAKRVRQEKLYKHVSTHTVQDWVKQFISRLQQNLGAHDRSHVTPMLDANLLKEQYAKSRKRLFLFDYDGTLTPIVKEPSAAIPTTRLYKTLERLTNDPNNTVWIISGRDSEFLDKWLGSQNNKLSFSSEHGCFLKSAGDDEKWHNLAEDFDMSWQKVVYSVFQSYTERTQGSSIEHKRAALTWHYRRADPTFGAFQAANLRQHLEETVVEQYDLEVMAGKANVEVRPRKFNKGEIVKTILAEYGSDQPDFVICLGDDFTDEDMFRALLNYDHKGWFPVTVGPPSKMTVAKYHLLDPHAVVDTLDLLVDQSANVYF